MYIVEYQYLGQSLPAKETNNSSKDKSSENLKIRVFRQRRREKERNK
jgi:hypothetical protein